MTEKTDSQSETVSWVIAAFVAIVGLYLVFRPSANDGSRSGVSQELAEINESLDPAGIDDNASAFVCRSAIAAVMGRPIEIVRASATDGQVFKVSYNRPDDGSYWSFLCRLQDDQVYWASIREDGSSGRWRNDPDDEKIYFAISEHESKIVRLFADGTLLSDTYTRD